MECLRTLFIGSDAKELNAAFRFHLSTDTVEVTICQMESGQSISVHESTAVELKGKIRVGVTTDSAFIANSQIIH